MSSDSAYVNSLIEYITSSQQEKYKTIINEMINNIVSTFVSTNKQVIVDAILNVFDKDTSLKCHDYKRCKSTYEFNNNCSPSYNEVSNNNDCSIRIETHIHNLVNKRIQSLFANIDKDIQNLIQSQYIDNIGTHVDNILNEQEILESISEEDKQNICNQSIKKHFDTKSFTEIVQAMLDNINVDINSLTTASNELSMNEEESEI